MLGERERDREAVQWELGGSTTPPFNNGDPHHMDGLPPGMQMVFDDDGGITTLTNYTTAAGGMASAGSMAGKEVRYAPLPNTQSPTHSNPISQAPLQRAHSR